MAKELPYFQYEPQEYLSGDISFCSLEAQGLFNHVMCHYWTRSCQLTLKQIIKRIDEPELIQELIDEGVIKWDQDSDEISIHFLDVQFDSISSRNIVNRNNGKKGGRPKKPKQNPSVIKNKPNGNRTGNRNETQTKPIREDNIREDNIREDDIEGKQVASVPNLEEVIEYFKESGYTSSGAEKMFDCYNTPMIERNGRVWKDSRGNTVKNWKQKARMVWFKDEFKTKQSNDFDQPGRYSNMEA